MEMMEAACSVLSPSNDLSVDRTNFTEYVAPERIAFIVAQFSDRITVGIARKFYHTLVHLYALAHLRSFRQLQRLLENH